jgi:hypothetical protein
MTDRLNPWPLISAHWKCLSIDQEDGKTTGDWVARTGLLFPSLAAGALMVGFGGSLANAGSLLAADSLLASSLFAVFAQVSSLRLKLSDRFKEGYPHADGDKDAMDETATHLLFAIMLALTNAAVLACSLAFAAPDTSLINGLFGGASAAIFVYTILLLLMLLPRLLYAYTSVNGVRTKLSGFHRD